MGKFSTLSVATSGLRAAQAGLYVTGHNMANTETAGYVRQQVIQKEFAYTTLGSNAGGLLQVGLGTDIAAIRQIRDKFLDISYRAQSGKNDFYSVKATTGTQIENIIGELNSEYTTDSVVKEMWQAIHELSIDPQNLAVRGNFVSTVITFIDKVNDAYTHLTNYQHNLNEQVIKTVQEVNQLVTDINKYNNLIMKNEISGDNANDYRDSRNYCLDKLSHLININYNEKPNGRVDIFCEGKELLSNGIVSQLGLRYTAKDSSFVEPVFTTSTDILTMDNDVRPLFSLTGNISANAGNDIGKLKGLLVSRGVSPANYTSQMAPPDATNTQLYPLGLDDPRYIQDKRIYDNRQPQKPDSTAYIPGGVNHPDYKRDLLMYERDVFNATQCFIPKVQKELDTIVHQIVTMINNSVSPYANDNGTLIMDDNAPYDLNHSNKEGFEIFTRKHMGRFDANGDFIREDPSVGGSLYTMGNIMLNPRLLDAEGYNYIALQPDATSGVSDNTNILTDVLDKWKNKIVSFAGEEAMSIDEGYNKFVGNFGNTTSEAINYVEEQQVLLQQIDGKRSAISGVSLDEEMTNMMKYQHAYNAAARMITLIDSMIDKIINGTGRVGM